MKLKKWACLRFPSLAVEPEFNPKWVICAGLWFIFLGSEWSKPWLFMHSEWHHCAPPTKCPTTKLSQMGYLVVICVEFSLPDFGFRLPRQCPSDVILGWADHAIQRRVGHSPPWERGMVSTVSWCWGLRVDFQKQAGIFFSRAKVAENQRSPCVPLEEAARIQQDL